MIENFERTYSDQSPYYEVWYGKVDISENRAFWFRYTLLDGKIQEASTWAVLFDEVGIYGDRNRWKLEDLAPENTVIIPRTDDINRFRNKTQVFHIGQNHLDEGNALGQAGNIKWDLQWSDRGLQVDYVPGWIYSLGLAKSAYNTCLMDLRVSGEINHKGKSYEVSNTTGMLGHIRGTKISGESWAWSHCNHFDDREDAVFEGLSARVNLQNRWITPPLSGFYVYVDGTEYSFLSLTSIFRSSSSYDRTKWKFESKSGPYHIKGEAVAPNEVALVEYSDTDGSNLWCYNSKLSELEVNLTDTEKDRTYELESSGRASYEWVTRNEPSEAPLID